MPWPSNRTALSRNGVQGFKAAVRQILEERRRNIAEGLLDLVITEATMRYYLKEAKRKGTDALQGDYIHKEIRPDKDERWKACITKCCEKFPGIMGAVPADCISDAAVLLQQAEALFLKYIEEHGAPEKEPDCVSLIADAALTMNMHLFAQKKNEIKPTWTSKMQEDMAWELASVALAERVEVYLEYSEQDQNFVAMLQRIAEAKTPADKVQAFKALSLRYADAISLEITSWGWTLQITVLADRFASCLAERIENGGPSVLANQVTKECLILGWLCSQVLIEHDLAVSVGVEAFEGGQITMVERTFQERRVRNANFAESLASPAGSTSAQPDLLSVVEAVARDIQKGMCPETFRKLCKSLKWSFFNGTFAKLHRGADSLSNRWKSRINEKIDEAAVELPLDWIAGAVKRFRLKLSDEESDPVAEIASACPVDVLGKSSQVLNPPETPWFVSI